MYLHIRNANTSKRLLDKKAFLPRALGVICDKGGDNTATILQPAV